MIIEEFNDEIQAIRALCIAVIEKNKIGKNDSDIHKYTHTILSNVNRMDEAIEEENEGRYLAFMAQEESYDDFINDEELLST